MSVVTSPVTGGATTPSEKLDVTLLINQYKKKYGVDVARFFDGLTTLDSYECADTGYRFFGQRDLSGDARFYTDLYSTSSGEGSKHSDGKWEHLHARELVGDYVFHSTNCWARDRRFGAGAGSQPWP